MKDYYRLIKPGIVYGNAMTALAAFLFASGGAIDWLLLAAMLVGIILSIASACVVNNVIDRDIDLRMERTKGRAIPTGRISARSALVYAAVLGVLGFTLLLFGTNLAALLITWSAVFVYVCLYTPLKRTSIHSTLVGAVAGAAPPVVGYAAATGQLDAIALCLFLILVTWQMVHFFAIAIFRVEDYRAAGIPVMPVRHSIARTKYLMIAYAILFCGALYAFTVAGAPGPLFPWTMALFSFAWLLYALSGFRTQDTVRWAKTMFFLSIAGLLLFSITLTLS